MSAAITLIQNRLNQIESERKRLLREKETIEAHLASFEASRNELLEILSLLKKEEEAKRVPVAPGTEPLVPAPIPRYPDVIPVGPFPYPSVPITPWTPSDPWTPIPGPGEPWIRYYKERLTSTSSDSTNVQKPTT